jgi:hypothetical protein
MKPIQFDQCNKVFGEHQPEVNPLPALQTKNGDVVTCWELTPEEVEVVKQTGKIWLFVKLPPNQLLQPLYMTVDKNELLEE